MTFRPLHRVILASGMGMARVDHRGLESAVPYDDDRTCFACSGKLGLKCTGLRADLEHCLRVPSTAHDPRCAFGTGHQPLSVVRMGHDADWACVVGVDCAWSAKRCAPRHGSVLMPILVAALSAFSLALVGWKALGRGFGTT